MLTQSRTEPNQCLALAAASRGFTVTENDETGRLVFAGHNAEIQLRVTENLSSKHGKCTSLDSKVGNVRTVLKNGNPNKRYFVIPVGGDEKQYFVNLIEARWLIKQTPDAYREITQDDQRFETYRAWHNYSRVTRKDR